MPRHVSALTIVFIVFFSALADAQQASGDAQAYCSYLTEQAKAQSDLLRTPSAIGAFTQPETGLPQQIVGGATLSLSNYKRGGMTLDAAQKNCELYQATIGVQQYLQYALPNIEREALRHRLELIEQASKSLDELIAGTEKMIAAQNMTRPQLLELRTNKIKLEADRADTASKISAIYVPSLSKVSLKQQVESKEAADVVEQQALARITRQSDWDVSLTVGAHQQINPVANTVQPYGEVMVSYNLASHAINRHLDNSVDAYSSWKKVQEGDVQRNAEVLRRQVQDNIMAQEERLKALQQEEQSLDQDLSRLGDPDTSAALDFRNQLSSAKLLLAIETGDSTFRLNSLQNFLAQNY